MQIPATPIKVLCVEDEDFISELYSRALQKEGYEVVVVKDGNNALKHAQTNAYDFILLDIMVPGILGVDILSKLRHEMPELKAKIIITTNLEQSDEVRDKIEKQADGYLIKADITPKQLVQFLNRIRTTPSA